MKSNSLLSLTVLLLLPLWLSAQPGPRRGQDRERIEAQKIAYLTDKLSLSPAEAQKFWPVYNEFNDKREKVLQNMRERRRTARGMTDEELTEAEASRLADDELIEAQQMLDLRKEYHAKFKSVLPASKVLRLYRAEEEFKRVLLDRLRGGKGHGGGKGQGPGGQ